MKQPKPEPVVVSTVCSLCGLDWNDHGDKPTAATCVDLLRAELAKRPQVSWTINPSSFYGSGQTTSRSYTTLSVVPRDEPPDAIPAAV